MEYLKKAINFLIKNYMLAIPLALAYAIPSLLANSVVGTDQTTAFFNKIISNPSALTSRPLSLITSAVSVGLSSTVGLISFILLLLVVPATYGIIQRKLNTGNAELNDFVEEGKENIVKYIIYRVGQWVLNLLVMVAIALVALIFVLLIRILGAIGIILAIIFGILAIIVIISVNTLTSLWFPAMMVDNMNVIDALKKSFFVVKEKFFMVFGVVILISLIGFALSIVFLLVSWIPLIGPAIASIGPAVVAFLTFTFYLMLYEDNR